MSDTPACALPLRSRHAPEAWAEEGPTTAEEGPRNAEEWPRKAEGSNGLEDDLYDLHHRDDVRAFIQTYLKEKNM
jgi:hypothetical protein